MNYESDPEKELKKLGAKHHKDYQKNIYLVNTASKLLMLMKEKSDMRPFIDIVDNNWIEFNWEFFNGNSVSVFIKKGEDCLEYITVDKYDNVEERTFENTEDVVPVLFQYLEQNRDYFKGKFYNLQEEK